MGGSGAGRELKVWVEGLERVVCGLTEATTCQETIYALAHATAKTGRFVLVQECEGSERSLAPSERPLELLSRWQGDSELRFVLKCLDDQPPPHQPAASHHNLSPAKRPVSTHYASYQTATSRPVAKGATLRHPPPASSASYSTGSLPRLRHPQRPALPQAQASGYARFRSPGDADEASLASLASSTTDASMSQRAGRAPSLPRNVSAPVQSGYGSFGAGSTASSSTLDQSGGSGTLRGLRKGASNRSTSSGASARRPPPPSYDEALSRLEALGRPSAKPSPVISHPNAQNLAPSNSIDGGNPSYQFPASRHQLLAMIQHQERQLRTQVQRLGLCDEKLEALSGAADAPGASPADEAELNRLEAELTRLRVELGPLRARQLDSSVPSAEASLDSLRAEAASVRAKTEEAEARLAERQAETAELERELARAAAEAPGREEEEEELARVREEAEAVERRLGEREAQLDALLRDLDSSKDSLSSLHQASSLDQDQHKPPGLWV